MTRPRAVPRLIAFALLLALPATASSQALSMEQAVSRAVARHPLVAAGDASARAAHARVRQAQTGWLPRVKLEGSYFLIGPTQQMVIDTGLTPPGADAPIVIERQIGSLHNAAVGVTVAWRAWDFGARDARTAAARAAEAAARADVKDRAAQVAHAVRASYLAGKLFEEMAAVTRRSLVLAQAELREEQIKKQAGLGSDLDLARVQIRIAELGSRLTQADQEQVRALITLRILLGLQGGAPLSLSDTLAQLAAGPVAGPDGKERHPAQVKLAALADAARLEEKYLMRSYWPTLDLAGGVKLQFPKNYFETDRAGPQYQLGAVLTWNVFDGDLLRRQREESRARRSEVLSLAKANDEEVRRQHADALARVRIAAEAAAAARATRQAAEVYERAARAALGAGTGTRLEVRKAEESLDQAHLGELKAHFDGGLARAAALLALGRATGTR
jgi:outer membrane protein TolC